MSSADVSRALAPQNYAERSSAPQQHALLEKLLRAIGPPGHPWGKRNLELVVGTDREIGRERRSQERRVAITPLHVVQLRDFFQRLGLRLTVLVLENAGARAGHSDGDYIRSGAEVITKEEVPAHDGPPDVVHALKEPSHYEADFPKGHFLRVGALHGGDFHENSGLARLLARGDVGVFDGSNIGAPGNFRIPIRGGMSDFAGAIAAEWTHEHLAAQNLRGRVVVVGGGRVGKACARRLLESSVVTELVVCESSADAGRFAKVAAECPSAGKVRMLGIDGLDSPGLVGALSGAVGVIFAVAKARSRAPRVVTLAALNAHLPDEAVIVDVSIDERGAIEDADADLSWPSDRLIPWLENRLAPRRYRAVANMPSMYPREASAVHGDIVVPYLAALLYVVALKGGAQATIDYLCALPVNPHGVDPATAPVPTTLAAFLQDLRNGLAAYPTASGLVLSDAVPATDRAAIEAFLRRSRDEGRLP